MTTLSYTTAALAFFLLFTLLITSWRGRLYSLLLAIACIASSIWAITIAGLSYWEYSNPLLIQIFEILRNASLTVFLIALLGPFQAVATNKSPPKIRPTVFVIALFYLICFIKISIFSSTTNTELDQTSSSVEFLPWVTMAIIGMILVEQYYRNTPHEQRWGIKFICLGIGGLFVYDFYLYSDALLFRKINLDIWDARGWINLLTVPLITLSTARNPKWTVGIAVSRRILFYSSALFGAAIYLLLMAAAGYYLRFSGGTWGTVFQLTFLFGAIILLIAVLFSGTTRAWLKVFISKHFFNYSYDYREEWLRFTRTLSEEGTELRIRVIQSLAQLVESPAGAVWFKSEQRRAYLPIARWNLPSIDDTSVDIDNSFCQFMQETSWIIDLHQYDSEAQQYAAMILPDWLPSIPKARWVIPLILHGELQGFVVLTEPRSTINFNWEVRDLLKVAGRQAASYLTQYETMHALSMARQFESFNRMSTFIVHDIKNLIAQLSLLLTNAEKHKNNPEFQQDMLDTITLSVNKMKRLLEKLSNQKKHEEKNTLLSLDALLTQIVANKSFYEPAPTLDIADTNLNVYADPSRLERVLGHLVQNAIEATPKNGFVKLQLKQQTEWAIIEIKDNGHGMSEQFIREKLFAPFESTKTAGMGIGVFESKEYIESIGGKLQVSSKESKGTIFSIMLPLAGSI